MLYYIEVNLICIVILLLFLAQMRDKQDGVATDQLILKSLIWAAILFCTADLTAGVVRGRFFPGDRAVIEISNLVYDEALAVISYLWFRFVELRREPNAAPSRVHRLLQLLPLAVFTVAAAANPFTHFLFSIDADNLYCRGSGILLHWVVVWFYFLVPTVRALGMLLRERHPVRRAQTVPLLCFAIAPAIASTIQMLCYGVTSTQVGITLSIAMIFLSRQKAQIFTDPLTGLNNKRALVSFMADVSQHDPDTTYVMLMIDIDHFKAINDRYGHLTGDLVLKTVAAAIKSACGVVSGRLFLCRFGGDEFIMVGVKPGKDELAAVEQALTDELNRRTAAEKLPPITVSIGLAEGKGKDESDLEALLGKADKAMYEVKAKL